MRNSNLLKWAQSRNDKSNRKWIHPPDTLQKGHIAYLVKFMGSTDVDQPKGIEVVKEGIRKLKFSQQIKKSEGTKIPKVELTISVDGVAIQEPKTKRILHQYPLHRISYCADDKGEKKSFSFIAKEVGIEPSADERHVCFVFVSDKLAEEITLTIGQAFDLAYKKFIETSGKDLEVQRRLMMLQKRIKTLENENTILKARLIDVTTGEGSTDLVSYMKRNKIRDITKVEDDEAESSTASNGDDRLLLNLDSEMPSQQQVKLPPVPPRSFEKFGVNDSPSVGTRLEGLLLDELDDFNPRALEVSGPSPPPLTSASAGLQPPPLLAPPPRGRKLELNSNSSSSSANVRQNLSPSAVAEDPFGMGDFSSVSVDIENDIGILDKKILEMKDGFTRGLAFGNEDFSIESLDPLRK